MISDFLSQQVSIAPLITFRILFGMLMMFSCGRFVVNGWIGQQYLNSTIYFTYYGFHWVKPLPPSIMYLAFGVMFLTAFFICIGFFYRFSAILFFLLFTYIDLIDKTYYLNHYYFISLISFLLIFIPAHKRLSIDVFKGYTSYSLTTPQYFQIILKVQVGMVYFFSGIAKINHDWLIRAMPLRIWLAANVNKTIIGFFFSYKITAYLFSWVGMLYDISIPFLLSIKKTRWISFVAVVVFHMLTGWLFPIGVFPIMMIISSLLFLSPELHERILTYLEKKLPAPSKSKSIKVYRTWPAFFFCYLVVQFLCPLRYLAYPGNIFWTEEGYRFSWRVMLMEKMAEATFYITDCKTGKRKIVFNRDYLSPVQEKMMATQPDMILQYAKFLKTVWEEKGLSDLKVTADIYVTLNGRRSKRFIDPTIDLTSENDTWKHKSWILPL